MTSDYNRRYWLEHGAKWTLKARVAAAESECIKLRAELEAEHELNHLAVVEIRKLRAALEASHPHVFAKPGCLVCEMLAS